MGGNSDVTWHFCPQITQNKLLGNHPQALEERLKQGTGQTVLLWDQSLAVPPTGPLPPGCRLPVQMQDWSPPHTCTDASCLCTPKQGLLITASWIASLVFGLWSAQYFEFPDLFRQSHLLHPPYPLSYWFSNFFS